MRARRFQQSVSLAYLGQAATMLAGFWMTPFLLRTLGQVNYGFWIAGQQLLVCLSLMDFGIAALLPRETAYAVGRAGSVQAAAGIPVILARTVRLIAWQTLVIALVCAALWCRMPAAWIPIRLPLGVVMLAFTLIFPLRIFRGTLEGLQDLGFIGWSYLGAWSCSVLATIALVLHGCGLVSLAAGWALHQALDALLCWCRLKRRFPYLLPDRKAFRAAPLAFRDTGRGFWVSVSQIAQVLTYGTDALIVGRLFGPAAIVPFNCTGKLINSLSNQPLSVMRAAEPGLSEMRTRESRERLASVMGALTLAVLLVSGAVATVTLAVNPVFVNWWVGPGRYRGLLLTALFAASMVLRHFNATATFSLFALGHERWLAGCNLADGMLSTVFSLVFAWRLHSVIGVVLGSILSTCCVLLFGNLPLLCRELGVSRKRLLSPLLPWIWRMAVAAITAAALSRLPAGPGFVTALWRGAAAGGLYAFLLWPVLLRSELRRYVQPHLDSLHRFQRAGVRAFAAARG